MSPRIPAVRRLAKRIVPTWALGSITGARTSQAVVALTFDDGPDPVHTPRILEVLDDHRARATFFLLSKQAEFHPQLARRISKQGHELALHGLDHARLTGLPIGRVIDSIRNGRRRLEAVVGRPVRLFRPPFGSQTVRSYLVARSLGLRVVGWTAAADDWMDLEPKEVARRAMEGVRPGAILLLHDRVEPDPLQPAPLPHFDRAEMVRLLLGELEGRGYLTASVGSLLADHPAQLTVTFPE